MVVNVDRLVYMRNLPEVDRPVYNACMTSPSTARDRILLTAHDLFYQHGVRATGVDRVIAEAGVTKVTFYRHFPSKNELILAYLDHRHSLWMSWFQDALQRHGGTVAALKPALAEWFQDPRFRGCAFINVVGELGEELPQVREVARQHKEEMARVVAGLLPASRQRKAKAWAIALAVDGAIVQVQMGVPVALATGSFGRLVQGLSG